MIEKASACKFLLLTQNLLITKKHTYQYRPKAHTYNTVFTILTMDKIARELQFLNPRNIFAKYRMIGGGFEYDLRTYAGDGTWLSRFKILQSCIQTCFHLYFEAVGGCW